MQAKSEKIFCSYAGYSTANAVPTIIKLKIQYQAEKRGEMATDVANYRHGRRITEPSAIMQS